MKLNINYILSFLPHRYPFIMVDRVLNLVPKKYIKTLKNITVNEPFFQGHFPSNPVMPGVLQLESIAQSLGILIYHDFHKKNKPKKGDIFYFIGINNTRFKKPVIPGDQLIMDITLKKQKQRIYIAEGIAKVEESISCKTEIMIFYKEGY